ncbi:MAG TPA: N-acetylmuramoyl-L-alanine amidase [Symbiobacteriaceae bacterium]
MTKLIVIDPGHCREEPGSVQVDGELEATYNLSLGLALRDALVNGYDCKVALTREGEEGMVPGGTLADELRTRGELPNKLKADFFLSIHHNSAGVAAARGAELYIHTNRRTADGDLVWLPALAGDGTPNHTAPNSYRLAATMQPIIRDALAEFGIPWRGDPDRIMCCDFAVLRYPNLPCALIETHYGTNPEDNAAADRPEFKTGVARGIARAIGTALELPPKAG